MTENTSLANISQKLLNANKIAVISHVGPDLDAIGSSMALYRLLHNMSKSVDLYNSSPMPASWSWIVDIGAIQSAWDNTSKYDLIVILDLPSWSRIGDIYAIYADVFQTTDVVLIDHHQPVYIGDDAIVGDHIYRYVNPSQTSCAEILRDLFETYMSIYIDPQVATYLWMAMWTDTGGLTYNQIGAQTYHHAVQMLSYGADKNLVLHQLNQRSISQYRFLARYISRWSNIGKYGRSWYEEQDLLDLQIDKESADAMLWGTLLGYDIICRYKISGDTLSGSLRSDVYDCSQIANHRNGGGHRPAAGWKISISPWGDVYQLIDECNKYILEYIDSNLQNPSQ